MAGGSARPTVSVTYAVTLAVVAVCLAAAAIPSPLYDVWREQIGFSIGSQGIVFGVYALTLIPALLLGAVLADKGRGWVVLGVGLTLSLVASLVFVCASTLWILVVARAVQGVSVGFVNASANVLALEFQPTNNSRRASVATATAVAGGLASGALGSGVLAEYVGAPTRLVFLAHGSVACVLLVILASQRRKRYGADGAQSSPEHVPALWSPALYVVCCLAVMAAWALGAMFLAVGPSYALELLHVENLALAGTVTSALFILACAAEQCASRIDDHKNLAIGLCCLMVGSVLVVAAFPSSSVIILGLGAVFCGVGLGLVFVSTLAIVNLIIPPERRRMLTALYFSLLFLANSLPVVIIGYLADVVGLPWAVTGLAAVIIVTALGLLLALRVLRVRQRQSRQR